MPCLLCVERGKPDNYGGDPRCGFDDQGVFTTDNWMCATLLKLRDLAEEGVLPNSLEESPGTWYGARFEGYDINLCVIETKHPEYTDSTAWIVLSFYKNRGRTGQAWFFYEDEPPRPITIADAERAITIATVVTVHPNVPELNLLSP
jgi:hypothetical protein